MVTSATSCVTVNRFGWFARWEPRQQGTFGLFGSAKNAEATDQFSRAKFGMWATAWGFRVQAWGSPGARKFSLRLTTPGHTCETREPILNPLKQLELIHPLRDLVFVSVRPTHGGQSLAANRTVGQADYDREYALSTYPKLPPDSPEKDTR